MKLGAAFPEIIYSFFLFSSFSRFVRKASYITSYITPAGSRARHNHLGDHPPFPRRCSRFLPVICTITHVLVPRAGTHATAGTVSSQIIRACGSSAVLFFLLLFFFCRLVPTIWERRRRRLISGRLLASRQLPLEYRWGFSLPCLFAMRSACYIIRCRAHVCAVLSCK